MRERKETGSSIEAAGLAWLIVAALPWPAPAARAQMIEIFDPADERPALEHETGLWTTIVVQGRHADAVRSALDIQLRTLDTDEGGFFDPQQLSVRFAAGYEVAPDTFLWVGVARFEQFDPDAADENRLHVQVSRDWDLGDEWGLQARLRFEQRFFTRGDPMATRLRALLRAARPLDARENWTLFASVESFLGTRREWDTFDQHRAFAGVRRRLRGGLSAEGGYQLQLLPGSGARPDRMRHNLSVSLILDRGRRS